MEIKKPLNLLLIIVTVAAVSSALYYYNRWQSDNKELEEVDVMTQLAYRDLIDLEVKLVDSTIQELDILLDNLYGEMIDFSGGLSFGMGNATNFDKTSFTDDILINSGYREAIMTRLVRIQNLHSENKYHDYCDFLLENYWRSRETDISVTRLSYRILHTRMLLRLMNKEMVKSIK